MERERDRERTWLCLYMILTCFHSLHSFSTYFYPEMISAPVLWPKPAPPCLFFPHWHPIFAPPNPPYLNYIFISYLTLSTLFSTLTGEDIHHQQSYILNQDTSPDIILPCSSVWHICQGDNVMLKVLCMERNAAPCVIELWLEHLWNVVYSHRCALISLVREHSCLFTLSYIRLSNIDSTASSHTFSSGGTTL